MKQVELQQMVHGYSKGHGVLASSIKLDPRTADIVSEISDLSGPLPASGQIQPYVTVYPLPSIDLYAIARTWPDEEAPRSGCVITHTLLLPTHFWCSDSSPDRVVSFLSKPERSSLKAFSKSLMLQPERAEPKLLSPLSNTTQTHEFVSKVFRDGLKSIVWFDCKEPDSTLWAFLRLLWPSLRSEVYASTFSLQPRTRLSTELQLHFAPLATRPRFLRFSKECQISSSGKPDSRISEEPWVRELAEFVIKGKPSDEFQNDLKLFGHLLSSDPTSIRSLFVLQDLTGRIDLAPGAAVGILDILESLEPSSDRGVLDKDKAVDTAINRALAADPSVALHCLYLVDARLRRPAFAGAAEHFGTRLSESVAKIVAHDPEALFARCSQGTPTLPSDYWDGVLDGLSLVAEERTSALSGLSKCPELAPFAISKRPRIAGNYFRFAAKSDILEISNLISWIHRVDESHERRKLRSELVADAAHEAATPLMEELLRDLDVEDVYETLEVMAESSDGFSRAAVRNTVLAFISERFPRETIEWGTRTSRWHRNIPDVVTGAFSLTADGAQKLLNWDWRSPQRQCEMWSAFVVNVTQKHLPQWFVGLASIDSKILEPFIDAAPFSPRANRALETIGNDCEYVAISRSHHAIALLNSLAESSVRNIYFDKAFGSGIVEYISGNISEYVLGSLFRLPYATEWCEQVSVGRIHELLTAFGDGPSWQRSWRVLAILPPVLFQRLGNRILQIVTHSMRSYRSKYSVESSKDWETVLQRSTHELDVETSLRLNLESLSFCLEHPELPVGPVVCSAFPIVYEAVTSGRSKEITDELFSFFDWDKAKKLRKDLIEGYICSVWPPEDLALVSKECGILRKIFSRLQRRWRGDDYISKMAAGLKLLDSKAAVKTRYELGQLLDDKEFFESWD